jgi:flagellar assembly protein FliH
LSSEAAVAPYAFEQLEAPPEIALRELETPLATAHAEAERIRVQAREQGYVEGRGAGLDETREQLGAALRALAEASAGIEALRIATAEAVERDAVELALALAEKIIAGALTLEPERVVDVVRGALRRLGERRRVTILVSPEDLDAVRAASDGFAAELGGIEHCDVQAERRVGRGGAIVRTEEGQIDACVETQLARARELVEAELGA